MRTSLVLLVLSLIALVFSESAQFPPNLSFQFTVEDRMVASGEKRRSLYRGTFSMSKASGKPHVESLVNDVLTHQTFTYRNGKLASQNRCLSTHTAIPSFLFSNTFLQNRPKLSDTETTFDETVNSCKGRRFVFHVQGEPFVLCSEPPGDDNGLVIPRMIIGKDHIVTISNVQLLSVPIPVGAVDELCREQQQQQQQQEEEFPAVELGKQPMGEPWFLSAHSTCRYPWLRDEAQCNRANIVATPTKICIFLHGSGQEDKDVGEPVQEFPEYWGKVHLFTPQCKERWFIREQTKTQDWRTKGLQEAYCKLALYNQTDTTVVQNKILFVHSMGNLILASAIKNGVCSIDGNTTSWYALGAPWGGSKAADVIQDICALIGNGTLPSWTQIYKLYKMVAEYLGYCMPHSNNTYPVYKSFSPSIPELHTLYPSVSQYIKGGSCGSTPMGLATHYSVVLSILSDFIAYHEANDGFVPQSSCVKQSLNVYEKHPDSQFYLVRANHADETCRNGNGLGIDRKPCAFYTDKE